MKATKGFTLVELMISILIVFFVLSGLALFLSSSIKSTRFYDKLSRAVYLATSERERIEAEYSNCTGLPSSKTVNGFTVTYSCSSECGLTNIDTSDFQVECAVIQVSWTDERGNHSVEQKVLFVIK